MTLLLAASLFFTSPAPLDMPRAKAYLATAGRESRLVDRYDTYDLWTCRAVIGRWIDEGFRVFVLSRLDIIPPALYGDEATRVEFESSLTAEDAKNSLELEASVACLSPIAVSTEFERPRQMPRGYKDVRFWQGTNTAAIVCSFLPEKSRCWYLATWELSDEDDFEAALELFGREFLDKREWMDKIDLAPSKDSRARGGKPVEKKSERELARRDARHGVAAYPSWHVTDAEDFTVIDCLEGRSFAQSLTNELSVMRARYSAVMPSPLSGSDSLCVARIYSNRDDYLEAAGEGMEWSAAFWNPIRRELVAYLPPQGEAALMKTIRHEAFHQYLSYACSMISASPWLNEGYAQYFEDESSADWGVNFTGEDLERFVDVLPALMAMDYREFYSGSDEERRLKYRLAWSIAYFIENGAPKVRFRPFEKLKQNYLSALIESGDMNVATGAAFDGSPDKVKSFISEWKKFWLRNM